MNQKSNGACLRATGSWGMLVRGEIATARFGGSFRHGTVKKDGSFHLQGVAADGNPLIYRGVLKGKSGSGTYQVLGAKCGGVLTFSLN